MFHDKGFVSSIEASASLFAQFNYAIVVNSK